jgi:hypothetical protein
MLVGKDFEQGTTLEVDVRGPDGEIVGSVRCVVAHSTPALTGLWRLGCTVTEGSIL